MAPFNPPFSQKQRRKGKPKGEPKPVESPLQKYRGALAHRSRKVKPSMPKVPEAKP